MTNDESGNYVQMSASANISPVPSELKGVFCSSSTAGTLAVYDSSATGTAKKIVDTFTLVAGQYYKLPFYAADGLYFVVGGTTQFTAAFSRAR